MPKKLKNIKLDRVDLVAEGANPGAHIEIFKHATEELNKATFAEIQDARSLGDMLSEVCQYTWDLQDAIYSSLYADGDRAAEVQTSVAQFSNAVDKALASWTKGEAVGKSKDNAAVAKVTEQLTKMKERLSTIRKEAPVSVVATQTPEEIKKQIDDAVAKATADANAAIAKQKAEADEAIAKANKAAEEAAAKATAAEAATTVEKEKRERAELVVKARSEFANTPGTAEEMADILFGIDKAVEAKVFTPELKEKLIAKLKAGNEAQKTLTGMEKGTSHDTTPSDGPISEINAKASEIQKAHPTLTKEQAFAKAVEENPELYRASQRARRSVQE